MNALPITATTNHLDLCLNILAPSIDESPARRLLGLRPARVPATLHPRTAGCAWTPRASAPSASSSAGSLAASPTHARCRRRRTDRQANRVGLAARFACRRKRGLSLTGFYCCGQFCDALIQSRMGRTRETRGDCLTRSGALNGGMDFENDYSRAPCPYSCARRDRARSGASPRHTGWPDGIVPPTTRSPSPEETRLRPQRSPDTSWLGWAVATFERLR
jgi:hypothetical protein